MTTTTTANDYNDNDNKEERGRKKILRIIYRFLERGVLLAIKDFSRQACHNTMIMMCISVCVLSIYA